MSWTVDAHHHLWDLELTPQAWLEDDALAPIRRSYSPSDLLTAVGSRVDRTVIVQTVPTPEETPLLLAHADETELIGGVVGWTDLIAPDIADRLGELQSQPNSKWLCGIRHLVQGESDPRYLCRSDVRRGLAAIGAAGLVYDLLTIPSQLEAAIETVAALPDVSFVVDHISKPEIEAGHREPWGSDIRRLAEYPNVTCKLSGMVTEANWDRWTVDDLRPYAETVLEHFSPERVMFGSDWPVCLLAGSYERVFGAASELTEHLSTSEREAVFGGTATRVYALDGRP